jgi:hypothetical protein
MRRVALNVLLMLVALVGSLGAAEALFRMFFCEPVGLFRQVTAMGYVMAPNYNGCHRKWGGFDIRIVTNELGYRDTTLGSSKLGPRVLALGDSVTFGWGVEAEQAYPQIVEEILREQLAPLPVDVVNAGVWGYNTLQHLQALRQLDVSVQPDVILLGITSPVMLVRNWNSFQQGLVTIEPLHERSEGLSSELREKCREWSHLCSLILRRLSYGKALLPSWREWQSYAGAPISERSARQDRASAERLAVSRPCGWPPSNFPVSDALAYTHELISEVYEWTLQNNAGLIVAILPSQCQLEEARYHLRTFDDVPPFNLALSQALSKKGISVVDLTDSLAHRTEPTELFWEGDFTHLNQRGHRLVGEVLSREVLGALSRVKERRRAIPSHRPSTKKGEAA